MAAKVLMIQGTGSHVGKSLLTAGVCRLLTQEGYRVLPFKAQNMSNNAYVTEDGGEIGRAQAEQAKACGVEPSVLMNPILLKPTTDIGAQVIVQGKSVGTMTAKAYQAFKPQVWPTILQALHTLRDQADVLVIEGAGSPAEINLKSDDLVNMRVAKQVQAKVLLVGDIDRGGVFAQLVGTMELLDHDEQDLVKGFIINKFRGDPSLLEPGVRWLEDRYGRPVVGVVPYLHDVELLEEDAVPEQTGPNVTCEDVLRIQVILLPRISNFTDFDPLKREADVRLTYLRQPPSPTEPMPDCVILPGTKSTIADLAHLRERGFEPFLHRHLQAGGELLGVCGGFQILGRKILDPHRLEATVEEAPGLNLLPITTTFGSDKVVRRARGMHLKSGLPVAGYEIHMGHMQQPETDPVFQLSNGVGAAEYSDGVRSADGRVWGTHLHGLFDLPRFRRWWLNQLRERKGFAPLAATFSEAGTEVYDRLADAIRPHLNLTTLRTLLES